MGVLDVARGIRRIVDVGKENVATAGEFRGHTIEDRLETCAEFFLPELCLLGSAAVHGTVAWRGTPIVMDEIVASGRDHDDTMHVRWIGFQFRHLIFYMLF